MKLSTKSKYALSALIAIYKENLERKKNNDLHHCCVSLNSIAKSTHLSSSYLEQLFIKLKKASLISSTKGNLGGYVLTKSLEEISVLDVMNAVGEKIEVCSKSLLDHGGDCPTRVVWDNLSESLHNYFASFTLKDIIVENHYTMKTIKTHRDVSKNLLQAAK